MRIRIGPVRRVFSLVVVGILTVALGQWGAGSAQSAPAPRANSQCLVPTPQEFLNTTGFVQIDVKPGNPQNRINPTSEGVVEIAICSEDPDGTGPLGVTFNALTQVVVICSKPPSGFLSSPSCRDRNVPPTPDPGLLPSTPSAGATGFEFSLHSCNEERDINGDGAKDLVCHFFTNRMNLTPTSTKITLSGCCKTPEFEGANAINCAEDCPPSEPPPDD